LDVFVDADADNEALIGDDPLVRTIPPLLKAIWFPEADPLGASPFCEVKAEVISENVVP
jgi:hypothetical protein